MPAPRAPREARGAREVRPTRPVPSLELGSKRFGVYDSIADLVPNPDDPSPLVRLSERFNPHPEFSLFLKLEGGNPFDSIKDHAALSKLRGTRVEEGQILIEPSSGNTGLALAALANAEGIPVEIAVPEGVPEEKKVLLRLLGVKL